ncbi:hypothetical protein O6H91_Y152600 [Diphasiastrum complanatum]|nr:hypothetical protein O6H91_Y152600 [Diphasiastrum complanatum]
MKVPFCVECGTTQNPCRCKIVGPTLGLVAMIIAAVIEWPLGAIIYPFRHTKGCRIMGQPVSEVYPRVKNAIPF